MVDTQYSSPRIDDALLEISGGILVAGCELNRSEIAHRHERFRVVRAQDALADVEQLRL